MKKCFGASLLVLVAGLPLSAGPNENLFRGIEENNTTLVTGALRGRADINARDTDGNTPLIAAFLKNRKNPAIIRLLLARRPDLNARNKKGKTALIAGVQDLDTEQSRYGFVDLLLKAGAKTDIRDTDGKTAFFYAAMGTGTDVAVLLARSGADVNIKDSAGMTPYMYYAGRPGFGQRYRDAVRGIFTAINFNPDVKDAAGMTALMHYIRACDQEMVGLILKKGANPNVKDGAGMTALHRAVTMQRNRTAVMKLLITAKADINARDNEGKTPLMIAVRKGVGDAVDLLMASKADTAIKDNQGNDVTAHAKIRNDMGMIRRLEMAGLTADAGTRKTGEVSLVDARGNFLRLDLYQKAVEDGDLAMVKKCVEQGAPLNIMMGTKTPLGIAVGKGHTAVADYLRGRGAVETLPRRTGTPFRP